MIEQSSSKQPAPEKDGVLEAQIEQIRAARDLILQGFPDSPSAEAVLQRYVDQIEESLNQGLPIHPEIVSGNDNLIPLQEAVRTVNELRGYTPEVLHSHFLAAEQAEALRLSSNEQLNLLVRYFGGWRHLSEDLRDTFSEIQSGIDAGDLPGLTPEQLRELGSALTPPLRAVLQEIYANHGRLLTVPETEIRSLNPAEQIERLSSRLLVNGLEFDTQTVREIGHGSEGTVYAADTVEGGTYALKVKHGPEVSRTSEATIVAAALQSLKPPYEVSPIEVTFEDDKVCVMEYLPESPDLQALYSYVENSVVPDEPIIAEQIAGFIHQYRLEHKEDIDLEALKSILLESIQHLSESQRELAGSSEWLSYFANGEHPLTVKPINFLVTGVQDGHLCLTCIDAR